MSFTDGFNSGSLIAGDSSGYYVDPRGCVTPSRSQGATYFSNNFSSSAGWTGINGGTGVVAWWVPGGGSTGTGTSLYAAHFNTGSSLSSPTGVQVKIGTIPSSYGIALLANVSSSSTTLADAMEFHTQSTVNNTLMRLAYTTTGLYVYDSVGTAHQISTHSNPGGPCEWWVENKDNGNGTHTITAYFGTELASAWTGILPVGVGGNAGLVMCYQQNDATTNIQSLIYDWSIGVTQLSDQMVLVGAGYSEPNFNGDSVNAVIVLEDTYNGIVLNTDLTLHMCVGTSLTWRAVTLSDMGSLAGGGILDNTKPVRVLKANFNWNPTYSSSSISAGSNVQYKLTLAAGKLGAILGVYHQMVTNG